MSKKELSRDEHLKKQIERFKKGRKTDRIESPISLDKDLMIEESGKAIKQIPIDKLVAAPEEWNFFPRITDSKMLEMIFSIVENGLFNPIIVWEQMDGNYMILSGHNRVIAYRKIIENYEGEETFNKEDFTEIPAIVYEFLEIDENKAREIIIDSNYIQREGINAIMPEIVKQRMNIVKNRKDFSGNTIDKVAEELDMSRTKVYEDHLLATKIIPKAVNKYFDGELNKKAVLRLAWFSKDIQEWIFDEFDTEESKLTNKMLNMLNRGDKKELIEMKFMESLTGPETTRITTMIPVDYEDEFIEMVDNWKRENSIRVN